MVKNYGKHFPI